MELSSFSENIVTEVFERNGESVELKINIDAIVPDYYDHLEERLAPLNKRLDAFKEKHAALEAELKRRADETAKLEKQKKPPKSYDPLPSILPLEKELAEIQREAWAEKLTCPVKLPDGSVTQLLKGWSIVENGLSIPPTKENLMRLPPKAVEELWERSIARATTVKKRVEPSDQTSENVQGGSAGLRVVGQST